MSELPSRGKFAHLRDEPMIDGYLPPGWRTVLREFGSGRLIDGEAINYEAATLRAAMWWAKTGAGQLPVGAASDIVNAALGIGGK